MEYEPQLSVENTPSTQRNLFSSFQVLEEERKNLRGKENQLIFLSYDKLQITGQVTSSPSTENEKSYLWELAQDFKIPLQY